jgi:hypothetical protein
VTDWIKAAAAALEALEADRGEPIPDDYEIGRVGDSRSSASFRIRAGHIRQLARIHAPASAEATGGGVAETIAVMLMGAVNAPESVIYRLAGEIAALAAPEPPAAPEATGGGVVEAARALIAARASTFTARNGRKVGIEDSSGEMCWIVPFDEMADLERALDVSEPPATPVPPAQGWRVKPLRWQGNSWPKIANFSFGQYAIYSDFEIFFNGYLVKNDGRHSFEGAHEIVRADLEARISAAIEPPATPVPPAQGWRDISTAPRDGTHILARNRNRSSQPPTTVHWFDGGWHLSVNRHGEDSDHGCSSLTDWHPLPAPEARISAAIEPAPAEGGA